MYTVAENTHGDRLVLKLPDGPVSLTTWEAVYEDRYGCPPSVDGWTFVGNYKSVTFNR